MSVEAITAAGSIALLRSHEVCDVNGDTSLADVFILKHKNGDTETHVFQAGGFNEPGRIPHEGEFSEQQAWLDEATFYDIPLREVNADFKWRHFKEGLDSVFSGTYGAVPNPRALSNPHGNAKNDALDLQDLLFYAFLWDAINR